MEVLSVMSLKGGVSKSSTSGILAEAAKRDGKRVLLIDLDPQRSLSQWYRVNMKNNYKTAYNIFIKDNPHPLEGIQKTPSGIDVIPGSMNLFDLKTFARSGRRLEEALKAADYDLCILDTPPGFSEILSNALYASTGVIIPLESDLMSLNGLSSIHRLVIHARKSKPTLTIAGAFIAKYDRRPRANKEMRDTIQKYCDQSSIPYLGEVRQCIKVREAMSMREPLLQYAGDCTAAADYLNIYEQLKEGGAVSE